MRKVGWLLVQLFKGYGKKNQVRIFSKFLWNLAMKRHIKWLFNAKSNNWIHRKCISFWVQCSVLKTHEGIRFFTKFDFWCGRFTSSKIWMRQSYIRTQLIEHFLIEITMSTQWRSFFILGKLWFLNDLKMKKINAAKIKRVRDIKCLIKQGQWVMFLLC